MNDAPALLRSRLASLYRALWRHAQGQRHVLGSAYALLLGAELVRLLVPLFTARAIDHVQQGGVGALRSAAAELAAVFFCMVVGWALHLPGRVLERNVALYARRQFSLAILDMLLRAPAAWHREEPGSQRAQRVIQSSEGLHSFAEMQYVYLQNVVMLFGPLVALWLLSPWVGLVATLGYGALGMGSLFFDRRLVSLNEILNGLNRRYQGLWIELLAHMPTVQALRGWRMARVWVATRLDWMAVPLRRIVVFNEVKWAGVDLGGAAIWCGLVALYAWLGAGSGTATGVALGSLYMVYEYARRAENVMAVIAGEFGQVAKQMADHEAATPLWAAPQGDELPAASATSWKTLYLQDLVLPRARFTAVPTNPLRLSFQRGRRYAVVGPSGGGKSTLLQVLAGLEPSDGGTVLLDSHAITAKQLRREATFLQQDTVLFEGYLLENLLLADVAKSEHVAWAMSCACVDDFMDPKVLNSTLQVAENGQGWSGGQRQRITLARGLLAAQLSAVVLLDEPTSALDPVTQTRVMGAVLKALDSACVVTTLHSLSLLSMFDEVIVMVQGNVIDSGPVDVVQQRCALLRAMLDVEPIEERARPLEQEI